MASRSDYLKQLWAPWRLGYVTDQEKSARSSNDGSVDELCQLLPGAEPDCFLCVAAASAEVRRHRVVRRGDHAVTLLNRYPYNNGHLLVSPRTHKRRLDALTSAEQVEISETITRMVRAIEQLMHPDGFNIGLNLGHAAGAGVPGHLHWHVVPRWEGDTNFMPTLAGARVIPQSLDALWVLLNESLE
ncbi:MAG: HIT domain-containing protein [Pirellulales bacterium]